LIGDSEELTGLVDLPDSGRTMIQEHNGVCRYILASPNGMKSAVYN
jgi:hypothetical protein